ncbi:hypothetical protein ANN_03372 [Periplaneta americana]|uniref:DUF4817 domain-containing protein n=1 Tax=Periplaneta americana TaxID=6978 RepID=A0ABQ8U2Y5_PERAM|nr:hypothetical protein ANN_03372 [Periplaneta americana]
MIKMATTNQQRAQCILWYAKFECVKRVQRKFRREYGVRNELLRAVLYDWGLSPSVMLLHYDSVLKMADIRLKHVNEDEETKQHYQVEISNRFATLGSSDEVEKELDVNSVWANIRDSTKIAAEQSIDPFGRRKSEEGKPSMEDDSGTSEDAVWGAVAQTERMTSEGSPRRASENTTSRSD